MVIEGCGIFRAEVESGDGFSREQSAGSSDRALFCDLFGRIATHESKIDL
jgi:hypothetical protein